MPQSQPLSCLILKIKPRHHIISSMISVCSKQDKGFFTCLSILWPQVLKLRTISCYHLLSSKYSSLSAPPPAKTFYNSNHNPVEIHDFGWFNLHRLCHRTYLNDAPGKMVWHLGELFHLLLPRLTGSESRLKPGGVVILCILFKTLAVSVFWYQLSDTFQF